MKKAEEKEFCLVPLLRNASGICSLFLKVYDVISLQVAIETTQDSCCIICLRFHFKHSKSVLQCLAYTRHIFIDIYFSWKKVQHCYIMAFARIFFSIFSQFYRSKTSLWRCMQYCLFLLRFVHKIKPWFKWVARENMCEYILPFILDKALCHVLSIVKNHMHFKRYVTRMLFLLVHSEFITLHFVTGH